MKRLIGKCWAVDPVRNRPSLAHRLLDRPGVPNDAQPGHLLTAGLIKLGDLPDDLWRVGLPFPRAFLGKGAGVGHPGGWGRVIS